MTERQARGSDSQVRSTKAKFYASALLACLFSGAYMAMMFLSDQLVNAWVISLSFVFSLIMLLLIRVGYLDWARWMLPLLVFGIVTYLSNLNYKLFDEGLFGYLVIVSMAAVLAGRRGALLFSFLSLIAIAMIGYFQINSSTPQYIGPIDISRPLQMAVLTLAAGSFMYVMVNDLLYSLQGLQDSQRALTQANRELSDLRDSLENQVAERMRQIETARQTAETARQVLEAQAHQSYGLAQLDTALHGVLDLSVLAERVICLVCDYLGAQAGLIYLVDGDELRLVGGCDSVGGLLPPEIETPVTFYIGQGMVGQAAQERRIFDLALPTDAFPQRVVLVPLLVENLLVGVLEIGLQSALPAGSLSFLAQAGSSVALAFQTARARQRKIVLEEPEDEI